MSRRVFPAELIEQIRDWQLRLVDIELAFDNIESTGGAYDDVDDMNIDHAYEARELLLRVLDHIHM